MSFRDLLSNMVLVISNTLLYTSTFLESGSHVMCYYHTYIHSHIHTGQKNKHRETFGTDGDIDYLGCGTDIRDIGIYSNSPNCIY